MADFGLAKRTQEDSGLTPDREVVGTPGYVAPEQIRSESLTPAADVYGLGAVLYECLTGQPPSRAATPFDTLLLTLGREPERPRTVNSRLPRDLEGVCLKCLEKEPRRRYPSAGAVADDLERWLRGEPVHAHRVGPLGRAWRWCRRKPVVAGLAAALALALGGGLAASLVLWRRAADNADWALANLGREEAARREAEEHYAMLRRLLTNNVRVRTSWVGPAYDPSPLPDAMLADAEACLAGLLRRRDDDVELRALLADVLTRLATGKDAEDPAAVFERAARLWERVPPEAAREPRHLASRASTYGCLGHAYALRGRTGPAVGAFETSFGLWKELAERHPCPLHQGGLFNAAQGLGWALIGRGDPEREVARRFEELRARPGLLGGGRAAELLLDLLRVKRLCATAEGHYRAGEQAAGLAAAREAAATLGRHLGRAPPGRDGRLGLAGASGWVSVSLRHGGARGEALRLAERVTRWLQEVAGEAREDPFFFAVLSQSWEYTAKARWESGRVEDTLDAYRQALATQHRAFTLAPAAAAYREELGWRHAKLGRKLCELGRLDEAEACFRERQALWPGDAGRQAGALRELRRWAAQVGGGKNDLSAAEQQERRRYLDLCARLEAKGAGTAPAAGAAGP